MNEIAAPPPTSSPTDSDSNTKAQQHRHPLAQELEVAKTLARQAGAAIMEHYAQGKGGVQVDYKDRAQSDPVTQADQDANDIIVGGLTAAFPGDAILAEESGPDSEAAAGRASKQRLWCVDPLDGTRDFVAHNGQFVVMIGLAIDGKATLGVLYHPPERTLYWGICTSDHQEAFMEPPSNDSTAQQPVALRASDCTDVGAATLMMSRSHRSKTVDRIAAELGVGHHQPLGSVGLKVAQLARGEAEMYISLSNRTQEWDACGPEAVIRGAGGMMTDACGRALRYNKTTHNTPFGMLATNGHLHQRCVDRLAPIAAERGW